MGKGNQESAYCEFGQVTKNGIIDGLARVVRKDGGVVEGFFKENKAHGSIRYINSNGDVRVGFNKLGFADGY